MPQQRNGIRASESFWNCVEIKYEREINSKLETKFLLIKYTKDEIRQSEFLEFLLNSIVTYALKKTESKNLNPQQVRNLWKIAKNRYVKDKKTGELGELILFHLLELDQNAVQIANKMSLKTAGGHHFHGVDAVHFGFLGEDKVFFIGSSKTAEHFSHALSNSIDELDKFYENEEKKDFEIALVTGNISDHVPKKIRDEIKDYLKREKRDMSKYYEIHAIFIGYDYSWLQKYEDEGFSGTELHEKVIEKYKGDIDKSVMIQMESDKIVL